MGEGNEERQQKLALLYGELNKFGQQEQYEKAVKTTTKILNLSSKEWDAFHYKIVCLIYLSKFEEALGQIAKFNNFSKQIAFERAYCLYRLNRYDAALGVIEEASKEAEFSMRLKELKAQILYRLERYDESSRLYRDIIRTTNDEYENERHTNLIAAIVNSEIAVEANDLGDLLEKSYEQCFNKACILIRNGQYVEAERKLKQCEKLCRESLDDDDATEEEIDSELALIRVQMGFVCQKQGRLKEAQQIYATALKVKLDDLALLAVANNNIVCINKDQNLFDSKKKMKMVNNEQLSNKLPSMHRKQLNLNAAILHFYLNQWQQCENMCDMCEKQWPDDSVRVCVAMLRSIIHERKGAHADAIALLSSAIDVVQSRWHKFYLQLYKVQLFLMQGDKVSAAKVLEQLETNYYYKPGIVGALTTLYLALGEGNKALQLFENCVEWYKNEKSSEHIDLSQLWRQAAVFHMKNGRPQVAYNSLDELRKTNPQDRKIRAQLVLAASQFDSPRAISIANEHLESVQHLQSTVDLETLDVGYTSAGVKKSPTLVPDGSHTPGTPKTMKKHSKRKRKGPLPKNYVSGAPPPDPERWLPRYERTGYRRKRDRRVKEVIKGSQGTAQGSAEQYDFSARVTASGTDVDLGGTVEQSPKVKPPQHHQKKGQNKKKGKRR